MEESVPSKIGSTKQVESTNPFEEPAAKNPFEEDEEEAANQVASSAQDQQAPSDQLRTVSPFHGLISRCFENHLNIFVDSQDK